MTQQLDMKYQLTNHNKLIKINKNLNDKYKVGKISVIDDWSFIDTKLNLMKNLDTNLILNLNE